ncbi:MAG: class I SAM-dependent methyltransferase [Actinomycetota bacterium]|nr:class I SAM-dependent methyltransferase [Actinomycetota bacterium]
MNLENEPAWHAERPVHASSEAAYDQLTAYAFARRYVEGRTVAVIGQVEVGYGSRVLAETAGSVTGLSGTQEAVDLASTIYSSPNVSYQRVALPKLPFSGDRFDVMIALGTQDHEHLETLVTEAKRVLKQDGLIIVSARDKQTNTNGRNRKGADGQPEMYLTEFRDLLGRHFRHVDIFRQGAVAGGLVFPASEEAAGASVESARFSLADPHFSARAPTTRSVIAVCSDTAEALGREERPYLLLDRDRRVFDECAERAEDIELMRSEIRQMQETEVQAFVDALKVRRSLLAQELPRYLQHITREHLLHLRNLLLEDIVHSRNVIRGNIHAIRMKGVRGVIRGGYRRSSALYQRLRTENRGSD